MIMYQDVVEAYQDGFVLGLLAGVLLAWGWYRVMRKRWQPRRWARVDLGEK